HAAVPHPPPFPTRRSSDLDAARSFENRFRLFDPAREVLQGLVIIGGGAALVVDLNLLPGANRKPIESGKSDGRSKSPILDVRSEDRKSTRLNSVTFRSRMP